MAEGGDKVSGPFRSVPTETQMDGFFIAIAVHENPEILSSQELKLPYFTWLSVEKPISSTRRIFCLEFYFWEWLIFTLQTDT